MPLGIPTLDQVVEDRVCLDGHAVRPEPVTVKVGRGMVRLGIVYRRGDKWWVRYRVSGQEVRRSASKEAGRPVRTLEEAKNALQIGLRRALTARQGLNRPLLAKDSSREIPRKIQRIIGDPDFILPGFDVVRQRAPIVYAWARGREILYVGRSRLGVARFLSENHHKVQDVRPSDVIMAWVFRTPEEAERAEGVLVDALAPRLNERV